MSLLLADAEVFETILRIVFGLVLILIAAIYWKHMGREPRPLFPFRPVMPIHPLIMPPTSQAAAESTVLHRQTLMIDKIRNLLGPPPRAFGSKLSKYLKISPPRWMTKKDDTFVQYQRQQALRERGTVVWASYAQANSLMFTPGTIDSGGSMIYSLDPWYDTHPFELLEIAHELYALKHTNQEDPTADAFARTLTNELIRAMGVPVPTRFTSGRVVYHASMIFPRKHLPKGYVSGKLVPVWVDPHDPSVVLMVPAAYWPAGLLDMWDEKSAPKPIGSSTS
jgi:hypothetical protein